MFEFHTIFFSSGNKKLTESSENDEAEKINNKSPQTNMLSPEGQTVDWPFVDQGSSKALSLINRCTFMMVPLFSPRHSLDLDLNAINKKSTGGVDATTLRKLIDF